MYVTTGTVSGLCRGQGGCCYNNLAYGPIGRKSLAQLDWSSDFPPGMLSDNFPIFTAPLTRNLPARLDWSKAVWS
jgi:hypothetical protein